MYKYADKLSGYQLEPGDLISFDHVSEPILIHSIDILENGYQINYLDEYGDDMLSENVGDDDLVSFYVYDED